MSEQAVATHATSTFDMIRTLGVVSAICGLVIVGTVQVTADRIEVNERTKRELQIFKIIPAAKSIAEFEARDGKIEPATTKEALSGGVRFFGAYDGSGRLAGVAMGGLGKGYGTAPVKLIIAYGPDCQCITGFGVVSMNETPGIGDKVITDKEFLANFEKLDARLKEDLSALANQIVTVRHGKKNQPWQIDAISGATVTSRAVGNAINDAAQVLLPKLASNLDKIRSKP